MKLLFSSDLHGYEAAYQAFARALASGPYEAGVLALQNLVGPQTILVTHSPPWGVLDSLPGARFKFGLKTLHQIPRPWMHLFGHVHECAGVEGTQVNGAFPALRRFFVVDTEVRSAVAALKKESSLVQ